MTAWNRPLHLRLIPTDDSESFKTMPEGATGIPLAPHPGSFGFERKNHIHEGIDLYAPVGTPVYNCQYGTVVAILPFTGEHAGSPWWNNTWAVMVEHGEKFRGVEYNTGVILYGEIEPMPGLEVGQKVGFHFQIGTVLQVLREDKGRPMSMLHLELYDKGGREPVEWLPGQPRPPGLRDPTPFLEYNCGVFGDAVADCPKDFPSCAFSRKDDIITCLRCDYVWQVKAHDNIEGAKRISP